MRFLNAFKNAISKCILNAFKNGKFFPKGVELVKKKVNLEKFLNFFNLCMI
jgi:hypothetical protein